MQRAGNRGARGAAIWRARNLTGHGIGRLRPFDQPPRHDDLLVVCSGPLDIDDGNLAVGALTQGAEKFGGRQRLDVALALQRLFVRIHRERHIDREHEFDIDRNGVGALVGKEPHWNRSGKARRRRKCGCHQNDER
jgi:hypothetical protein